VFDPPPAELAAPFWRAIDALRLVLPRCTLCEQWQWYPPVGGTDCPGGDLRWEEVAETGTLYSFTVVHRSFLPGGRERVPYAVGLVDLDGLDGPRLVATLDGGTAWRVGDRVQATFVAVGDRMHPVFRHLGGGER
jgi:uncharacterized OB-fold protein